MGIVHGTLKRIKGKYKKVERKPQQFRTRWSFCLTEEDVIRLEEIAKKAGAENGNKHQNEGC